MVLKRRRSGAKLLCSSALPFTSCVTLGKLLNLSGPLFFLSHEVRIIILIIQVYSNWPRQHTQSTECGLNTISSQCHQQMPLVSIISEGSLLIRFTLTSLRPENKPFPRQRYNLSSHTTCSWFSSLSLVDLHYLYSKDAVCKVRNMKCSILN